MPDNLSCQTTALQQYLSARHRPKQNLRTPALATLVAAVSLTLSLTSTAAQSVEVLSTIKPLQMISQAITGDIAHSDVLLPPNASPHHYQLRPSEQRKLQQADVLLWVGPEFEIFLRKPVAQLEDTEVLQWMTADIKHEGDDDHSTQARGAHHKDDDHEAHNHEEHNHEEHKHEKHGHSGQDHDNDDHNNPAHEEQDHGSHKGHEHDEHEHGGGDPHIWLSPEQAVVIAERLAKTLVQLDPAHSQNYRANLATFKDNLASTDAAIRQQLAPVKELGYFVFHDAYSHFEAHYGLNHLGAFSLHPGQPLGAKHLKEIQHEITEGRAVCVFTEPQFKPDIVKAISRDGKVRTGELDPMGINIPVSGSSAYPAFLQALADSFSDCLQRH